VQIAILGGTGPQGRGLASRFARAGHQVKLGSRDAERAGQAADDLNGLLPEGVTVIGGENADVVQGADLTIIAVPFDGQKQLLSGLADVLAGQIVVSCVNPLGFDDLGPHGIAVDEGSAAQQAESVLVGSTVVAGFHHLAASVLLEDGPVHDETVMVCGDDPAAKRTVIELCDAVAARGGVDAGPLRNARYLEPLTAVLISINKAHKAQSGIAIAGV
jgi:8-hydroxy-5-deazaflavin:NADPH oxidoreductase